MELGELMCSPQLVFGSADMKQWLVLSNLQHQQVVQ